MMRTDMANTIDCDCGPPSIEYATEAAFPFSAARSVLNYWRHIEISVAHAEAAWMSTSSYQPAKQCDDTADADALLFLSSTVKWVLKESEGRPGSESEGEGFVTVFQER